MGPAMPAAGVAAAMQQQRAALQGQLQAKNALPPQGGANNAAPHQSSTSSATTSAGMLKKKVVPTVQARESVVEPKTKTEQQRRTETIFERVQRLATELQELLEIAAALDAEEDPQAELLRQITDLRAVIVAHIGIDMWENGDFERAIAEPFFWELFAQQGNLLFEALTVDKFAVALRHLNQLAVDDRGEAMRRLFKLEDALGITADMKEVTYLSRLRKLKLLIEMRDLVYLEDKIRKAVREVALLNDYLRDPEVAREVRELTELLGQ
jgi:hypothetical protein